MTVFRNVVAFASLLLCFAVGVSSQTEPLGGQPSAGAKPSLKDIEEQVVYQRAFEAVIWSQPAVGEYGLRRGAFALGMKDNEILAMSRPLTTRHEVVTGNNATPYILGNGDLRNGPLVLEVPPASQKGVLYGQVVDAWQETIADVGRPVLTKVRVRNFFFYLPATKKPLRQAKSPSLHRTIASSSDFVL